jgi:hypothetical protein
MHFHPILLVQADSLEEAKIQARDFCEVESGGHSYFDYGDIVPDEETEWNKPLSEVRDKLPIKNNVELAMGFIAQAERRMDAREYGQAGYLYRTAGQLLEELFCVEYPLFNIQYYDYSREDYGEGWYVVEADLHC